MSNRKQVVMIGLSYNRQGGVASVLKTFHDAGFFQSAKCEFHASCLDGSGFKRTVSTFSQFLVFICRYSLRTPMLVHIHLSSHASFWRKVPYLLFCHLRGIRILVNIHPSHFYDFYLAHHRSVHPFLDLAMAIGFANRSMIPLFQPYFPDKKLYHLPNPVDLKRYYASENPSDSDYALFLGAMVREKGVDDIIEAAEQVIRRYPRFQFILCGHEGRRRILSKIRERGLDQTVQVFSWVDYAKKLMLLQDAKMVLLPSYSEGFPVVVLEAMGCKVPVVTTPVGELAIAVQHEKHVLFVDPGDSVGLAHAIMRLIGEPGLRRRLITAGHTFVEHYDIAIIADQLESIHAELIAA